MKESEENMKEKYMYLQMLQEQMEQLTQQVELMQQYLMDLQESVFAIEELKKADIKSELLAPITNGIFVKASLMNTTQLLVNVGANTVVEKSAEEVIILLSSQQREIAVRLEEAQEVLQQLAAQAQKAYREVEQHVR